MRVADRVIGVTIGVLLGLAIVAAFVFLGSGQTIDDPDISGESGVERAAPQQPPQQPAKQDEGRQQP